MPVNPPPFIPEPFANFASSPDINFPIPDSQPSSPANAASWHVGFPSITMQPEVSGGLPPLGQDFNGVLYTLSANLWAQQAGQPYLYNSGFQSGISGYALGAILGMADGTGLWMSTVANNANNPDTVGSASSWVALAAYGFTTLTGLTGGSVTPTDQQLKYAYIILQGALTSNLTLLLPENYTQSWLFINETTGSFTTTVKTAGVGSTGVTIPQGGPSSPTGVYTIADGNVYPTVSPLSVPISVPVVPSTLAERDNTGNIFGAYFNGNTGIENPAVGAVIVQNTAADGYFRKISLANLASQMFAGTVNAASGSVPLPGGIIIKWGSFAAPASGAVNVSFNAAFPNGCYAVVPSQGDSASYGYPFGVSGVSKSGFTADAATGGINAGTCYYIAIGH